jgi:hypothetical protein
MVRSAVVRQAGFPRRGYNKTTAESEDAAEGIRSFVERRAANFKGR